MKFAAFLITFVLLFGVAAIAQDVPRADLFLGYSFLRANSARNIPAFTANGGLGSFGVNLNNHIGFEFEFGGFHNGNIHNVQFDTTMMTYLFGPRFSLGRSRRVDPYLHTLFGGIHLTTSLPVTVAATPTSAATTTRIAASQDNFAMALGGGLDVKMNRHMTLRPIQLDYVMTRLEDFGQSGIPSQNRNQHNLRYAAGLMFTFGGERPSPPPPPPPPPPAPPRMKDCPGGSAVPIDQNCPNRNISLGLLANPNQICQGSMVVVSPNGAVPEGAVTQWTINGDAVSQARTLEFGSTGRNPGAYRVGLKITAEGYNDASADTSITVLEYVPPSGTLTVSPGEISLGEKATLNGNFKSGQCGGALGPVTYSAAEGSVSGAQYDSTGVAFAPPTGSEQRKTIALTAKVTDERGSGSASANVVVKQPAVISATQLPDVLFAQGSDDVNNCGKRVLLEELRNLANNDPAGRVVFVGHTGPGEQASKDLDLKRAMNAAAVISAGTGVCTAFPASRIYVNAAGAADNGVVLKPNFCSGSTAVAERAGQRVDASDDSAKFRRVEVWFVPSNGALPASAAAAKDAGSLGVAALGCPR